MSCAPWTPALEAELRYLIRREYRRQQRADASCRGKNGFQTAKHAHQAIPARAMHGHVTVYRCEVCHLWHVGSHLSPKRRLDRSGHDLFPETPTTRRSA